MAGTYSGLVTLDGLVKISDGVLEVKSVFVTGRIVIMIYLLYVSKHYSSHDFGHVAVTTVKINLERNRTYRGKEK